MRLAIVGSTVVNDAEARAAVRCVIEDHMTDDQAQEFIVISGGAKGVDTIAEQEAERLGIPMIIYRPKAQNWPAFKERNQKIADDCTKLVRIVSKRSKTYGSGWTRDRAAEQGKLTAEVVVS